MTRTRQRYAAARTYAGNTAETAGARRERTARVDFDFIHVPLPELQKYPLDKVKEVLGNSHYVLRTTIRNMHGLHARPAAALKNAADEYDVTAFLRKGANTVSLGSLMGMLSLECSKGSEVFFCAETDRGRTSAQKCLEKIRDLISANFDED